jgi:aminoglycoside 2'-N-acetyltransferase I
VDLSVVESPAIDTAIRVELRSGRFDDHDEDHAFGGVHVLARVEGRLVGHASAVPRRLRFGEEAWETVGYVEAVAVDPDEQRQGIGRDLMTLLHREIGARWPVAMLSTGRATGFYESLGWKRWRGLSYTLTTEGTVVADGEHGGLMAWATHPSALHGLHRDVTCEDRAGDAW